MLKEKNKCDDSAKVKKFEGKRRKRRGI